MSISHASFDMWGTLIKSNPTFGELRDQMLASHFGVRISQAQTAYKAAKVTADNYSASTGKQMPRILFYKRMGEVLDRGVVTVYSLEYIDREIADIFQYHKPTLNPQFDDVIEYLQDQEITMSILSNVNVVPGHLLREVIPLHPFKFWIFSDETNYLAKPNPEIFKMTERHAKDFALPGKFAHIGDSDIFDGPCTQVGQVYVPVTYDTILQDIKTAVEASR